MSADPDDAVWLLDLQVGGRTYHWSTIEARVKGTDYHSGLADPGGVEFGGTEQDLVILDSSVDWTVSALDVDGGAVMAVLADR